MKRAELKEFMLSQINSKVKTTEDVTVYVLWENRNKVCVRVTQRYWCPWPTGHYEYSQFPVVCNTSQSVGKVIKNLEFFFKYELLDYLQK